jgi:sugar phosphate isomerase/epimerase
LDRTGVDAVYRAAELGLSAIQIDAGEPGVAPLLNESAVRRAYQRAAQEAGVRITALAVNLLNIYGMTNPAGSEKFNRCWDAIVIALDAAADMDVELVYLPSFNDGEIRGQADLARTAEVLQRACRHVEDTKVLVATENTLGPAETLLLIEAVAHPKLRVLIDSLNPVLWGHRPSELVHRLWPYMCNQVHAKDGTGGVMGNALLNTGQANFAETVSTLQLQGFSGYVILENEYPNDFQASIARDMATIRRLFDAQEG